MEQKSFSSAKIAIICIEILAIAALAVSAMYFSSFLAIIGFSLLFWGAILLYLIPIKSNCDILVSAAAQPASENIERFLSQNNLTQNGIYLSTDYLNLNPGIFKKLRRLEDVESAIVFIPSTTFTMQDSNSQIRVNLKDGVFFAPPGGALCRIIEQQLRKSFSLVLPYEFSAALSRVLAKELRLVESIETKIEEDSANVKVTKSVFKMNCRDTDKQPQTHKQVGCLLSSSIACALAKTINKPVIKENESQNSHGEIMQLQYKFLDNIHWVD